MDNYKEIDCKTLKFIQNLFLCFNDLHIKIISGMTTKIITPC